MKSSAKKIELASVDDLFTTEQERQQAGEERVVRIPLSQLHYFKGYSAMQTEVPFTGQPYLFITKFIKRNIRISGRIAVIKTSNISEAIVSGIICSYSTPASYKRWESVSSFTAPV